MEVLSTLVNKDGVDAFAGMSLTRGSAVLDFGSFPGSNEASVTVTGQAGILSTHIPHAEIQALATSDHTTNDHAYAALFIQLICGVPTDATGFTIFARSLEKMQGTYNIQWNY